RAAAVEQLSEWGERAGATVVAQAPGADPAAVIFDALSSARARGVDVVIADTAGRLHTSDGLMDELRKIKRVMGKIHDAIPHETLLVLDASQGQNALVQATEFHQALELSGLIVTKLDGTAKGGILLAIARQLGLPVRFLGTGEGEDDLQPFNAQDFTDALLGDDDR
ncbi:MAG: signaling recognition particle receptor family protein, partial [Gammaproteobacteria bacterium]